MNYLHRFTYASLLVFFIFLSGCDTSGISDPELAGEAEDQATTSSTTGYKLIFEDNFNGPAYGEMDLSKWAYRKTRGVGGSDGRRWSAYNTKDAVYLDGKGNLVIDTYTKNGEHRTGMIRTHREFKYGAFEARVKFEDMSGVYSDFWLQTPTIGQPIGDPEKAGVEIDIFEHRQNKKNGNDIGGQVRMGLHWDGYGDAHKNAHYDTPDLDLDKGWHTFRLEWTKDQYTFYINGKKYWSRGYPISQRSEYVILSTEVNNISKWAGVVPNSYGPRGANQSRFFIDYVRVYEMDGTSNDYIAPEPKPTTEPEPTVEPDPEPTVEPEPQPTTEQGAYNNTVVTLPGRIEAEHYDVGGEGVAYHDTDARNRAGQSFRANEGVDATNNMVGWMRKGEWLEYTVNVEQAGTYDLIPRVASIYGSSKLRIESGSTMLGSIMVPNTGSWSTYRDARIKNVRLAAGEQVLRVFVTRSGFNLDRIDVVRAGAATTTPTAPVSEPVPSGPAPSDPALSGSESTVSGNLLKNAGFENGTTSWKAWGSTLSATSNPVYAGSKAAVVKGRGQSYHGPVQDITSALRAQGQGRYAVKAAAKSSRGGGRANVIVKVADDAGTHYHMANARETGSGWIVIDNVLDVKWTGTLRKANFYVSLLNTRANLHVDSASMQKVN